ncbi:MAG: FumA C-terminus/TtdB family hydratase beta subunit [Coriobacteriia bacterium]|nr:FumA C-terminus/TtdB family hydratase beta subunit [Coriobacteriia bacterium]
MPINDEPPRLDLPPDDSQLRLLKVGEEIRLFGTVYTMRDAGHQRCLDYLSEHGELPFGLAGQALFYAGPTPARAGRPFGAIGPTTAARMDGFAPQLYEAGIKLTLAKGKRSEAVAQACKKTGGVYLTTVGGAAALLGRHVLAARLIAWADLGPEALYQLELADFPAWVAINGSER